ncbi:hypothetical protein KA005_62970 [bacterium]|nr:hypothetical protein [bacterium]
MNKRLQGIKEGLRNIREFFWPILEPFSEEQIKSQEERIEKYSRENFQSAIKDIEDEKTIELILGQAEKLFSDEDNRLESVERKCAIIIGFSGVAIMLSFGFIQILFDKSNISLLNLTSLFMAFLFVNIYLVKALLCSVQGLTRKGYYRTDEKDIYDLVGATHPKKQIASVYIENRVKNFSVINEKVDHMHMAILFFKRALIAAFTIALIYFLIRIGWQTYLL